MFAAFVFLLAACAHGAVLTIPEDSCPDNTNQWLWWLFSWLIGVLFFLLLGAAVVWGFYRRDRRPTGTSFEALRIEI